MVGIVGRWESVEVVDVDNVILSKRVARRGNKTLFRQCLFEALALHEYVVDISLKRRYHFKIHGKKRCVKRNPVAFPCNFYSDLVERGIISVSVVSGSSSKRRTFYRGPSWRPDIR